MIFKLTKDHVKLIRRMLVGWQDCETGAPEIDPKRPYGNSNVAADVAEILGIKPEGDDEELSEDQEEKFLKLHDETERALQVVLSAGSFTPGTYEGDEYGFTWKRKRR